MLEAGARRLYSVKPPVGAGGQWGEWWERERGREERGREERGVKEIKRLIKTTEKGLRSYLKWISNQHKPSSGIGDQWVSERLPLHSAIVWISCGQIANDITCTTVLGDLEIPELKKGQKIRQTYEKLQNDCWREAPSRYR